MGMWKQVILESLRDDFEVCASQGRAWESLICEYLHEQKEQSTPVQTARLFALGNKTREDAKITWPRIADLLLEAGKLCEYEALIRISGFTGLNTGENAGEHGQAVGVAGGNLKTKRAANKYLANWLRDLDDAATPDWEDVRQICLELAAKSRTRNVCERLLEYDACCDAGPDSLMNPSELEKLLGDVRKRGKRSVIWLGKDGVPSKDARKKSINTLLVEEAKTWLYNTGISREGEDSRSSSRVNDIPIDLVEKCCRADEKLGKKLGFVQRQSSGITESGIKRLKDAVIVEAKPEDIRKLYFSLAKSKRVNAIVPIAQDALSGLGLYVIGAAFADPNNVDKDLLESLFKHKRSADEEKWPFLAIMYRYQDMSPGHFRTANPELFEPGTFESFDWGNPLPETTSTLTENLWHSVVYAWVPNHKGSFAGEALRFFRELCDWGDGLPAYQNQNGNPPEGCPEQFKRYFAEEGY